MATKACQRLTEADEMSVCLIFPPPWDTSQPYLSTAALAQHLIARSIPVTQLDLNLQFVEYLLEPDNFTYAVERLHILARSPIEAARNAAQWNLTIHNHLAHNLSVFPDTMRSSTRFYDSSQYFRAQRAINKIYDLWSTAYYPTQMTPISFRPNIAGNHLQVAHEYVDNRNCNPIIRFAEFCATDIIPPTTDITLFGISIIYDDQIIPALTIARMLKSRRPSAKIVLGGGAISQYARLFGNQLFQWAPFVDYVVVDDGYEILADVANSINNGYDPPPQPNLLINGSQHPAALKTPVSESYWVPPNPDFDGLPLSRYHSPEPFLSFKTSKGCKWSKCTFCSESAFKEYSPAPAADIVATIAHYVSTKNLRFVNFADSDISPSRFSELSSELLRQNVKVGWSIRARLDPLFDFDTLALGSRAGCRKIYFGLESASQRILKLMRKGTNIANVPSILQSCIDNDILTHLFTFIGFPTETHEEAHGTKTFIRNHISLIASFNIGVFQLRTFSDAYTSRAHLGLETPPPAFNSGVVDSLPYNASFGLSQTEASVLQQEFLEYFRKLFIADALPYEINKWSGYVNLRGTPYWDCHNLAYADYALSLLHAQERQSDTHSRITVPSLPFEVLREDERSTTIYLPGDFRTVTMSTSFFAHYKDLVGRDWARSDLRNPSSLINLGLGEVVRKLG